jgi:hypothetical protein
LSVNAKDFRSTDPVTVFVQEHAAQFATNQPDTNQLPICKTVLLDLRAGTVFRKVDYLFATRDFDDRRLKDLNACRNFVREGAGYQDLLGARDLGDVLIQEFPRSVLSLERSRNLKLYFGEYSEKKLALNTYWPGYKVVDIDRCELVTMAPVLSTPPPGSARAGAMPWAVAHGIYTARKNTWVLIANAPTADSLAREARGLFTLEARPFLNTGHLGRACRWLSLEKVRPQPETSKE